MKAILLATLLIGCGSNGTTPGGDDEPPPPDAAVIPEGFTRLIGRTWSLPSGATDTYRCARFTVPEDTFITSIMAQAPTGTHHTVLSFASSGSGTAGPDGEQNCGVGTIGTVMLYASGVGTDALDFPVDVGIKISAGQQIHLNLHLFNATDNPIDGDTAILVKSQPTAPPMLAEMVFSGTTNIILQNNPNQDQTRSGGCTSSRNFNLFAVWPHQHQIGTHHKFSVTRNGNETVLHDAAFNFMEQKYYPLATEFAVQQGDQITTTCSWRNDTGGVVTIGESSEQEMCFTGMYRYPAQNADIFECSTGPSL